MSIPFFTKGQLYDLVRERTKCHEEPFSPKPRTVHDGKKLSFISDIRLFFKEVELTQVSDRHNVQWIIEFADIEKPLTLKAKILVDRERVVGIDPNKAPVSYRYDNSTRKRYAYHQNVIRYDANEKRLEDPHQELKVDEHFTDIYKFAKWVADTWNIEYWKEKELLDECHR